MGIFTRDDLTLCYPKIFPGKSGIVQPPPQGVADALIPVADVFAGLPWASLSYAEAAGANGVHPVVFAATVVPPPGYFWVVTLMTAYNTEASAQGFRFFYRMNVLGASKDIAWYSPQVPATSYVSWTGRQVIPPGAQIGVENPGLGAGNSLSFYLQYVPVPVGGPMPY